MLNRSFVVIALVAAVVAGCARSPERELAWLDQADPAKAFAESSRAGRLHFVEVCGIGCISPGVGILTRALCYPTAGASVEIDTTGDVIVSPRHMALKNKAYQFAERFNALVLSELNRTGRRSCPETERWDAFFSALDSVAKRIPAHPNHSFVEAFVDLGDGRPDFQLHVQDEADLNASLSRTMCALAPSFGVVEPVRFRVTTGDINDHPKQHPDFTCMRGTTTQRQRGSPSDPSAR